MQMIPKFYQTHLKSQLNASQYLTLTILISLLQSIKQVRIISLANAFSLPVTFEARHRRIQRLLSLPQLSLEKIWLPIFKLWLNIEVHPSQIIYVAIDRTSWRRINLLMVSLIWDKRAYPIYFELLPKLGSSNLVEQQAALTRVFPVLKEYKTIVLGDREFCSVKLANWLREKKVYFCLRLKKNEFIQVESETWVELERVGLAPGLSLFLEGVRVTKNRGIGGFNVAAKWKKKYQGWAPKEGWFILTNLASLLMAIKAYKKRFGLEEMFRDFKSGGYNLEDTKVTEGRLISLIILIALAYTSASLQGKKIKQMGVAKYVCRLQSAGRNERRHSNFYIGLYRQKWVNYLDQCGSAVADLMRITPSKRSHYQRGQRAMKLILSTM